MRELGMETKPEACLSWRQILQVPMDDAEDVLGCKTRFGPHPQVGHGVIYVLLWAGLD